MVVVLGVLVGGVVMVLGVLAWCDGGNACVFIMHKSASQKYNLE